MNKQFIKSCLRVTVIAVILVLSGSLTELRAKEKPGNSKQKPLNILTIGDSNGALPFGWVYQLKKIRTNDTIFNISVSGNTIGFNNLGRSSLNTLSNIGSYMNRAYERLGKIDRVVIMIGTNDCKAVFKDSLSVVPANMRTLIMQIRQIARTHKDKPVIYIVSPPPFGPDEMLEEKYKGGMDRVVWLNSQLEIVAREESVKFVNACGILAPVFRQLTTDGVHLNPDGQKMIALIIQETMKY